MEGWAQVNKDISARVRIFLDDVVAGNVNEEVLRKHKIPQVYLDVCRNPNHPSCQKFQSRLFEYLMRRIGYYANINKPEKLKDIWDNLEELLSLPKDDDDQEELYMPRIVLGLTNVLNRIERLNGAHAIDFAEKTLVQNVQFGKGERCFQLSYEKDPRISVSFEDFSTPASKLQIDGEDFEVPENGGHLSSHTMRVIQPDEVTIQFDKFHHSCLNPDKPYYFRYITEVNTKDDLLRTFEGSYIDIDGKDIFAIDTMVDGVQLLLYYYPYNDKRYLIIEYEKSITAKGMSDLCFSTLVAFGMITTTVHLNECWMAAYEGDDKLENTGMFYQSLAPTVKCDYWIFTTNVYPSLVHIAKNIDPAKGENRACELIGKLGLSNALPNFPSDVFGRLVENMRKYEELQRGIFIILMGSKLHLEIQAATYCVALEAISNLAPKIISQKEEHIINDKKAWKNVKKRLNALIAELCEQEVITEKEKADIKKKIESMNKAFNSEKLRALLEYYHYPLRQFDDLTLFLRNLLLHGSIKFKVLKGREPEDYLFELSMNLHKLCCAIALLMSGYKGYIVNNRKLYDYANSYKVFIRIGDNVKEDYLEYKEQKTWWVRVCDTMLYLWRMCFKMRSQE